MLYIACLGGHLPLVKYLLNERQVNKDEKIKNGATPMTAATEAGHDAVVKYLESFDVSNKVAGGRIGTIGEGEETSTPVVSKTTTSTTTTAALKVPDSPNENSFSTPVSHGRIGSLLTVGDMGSTANSTVGSRSQTPGTLEDSLDDSDSPKAFKPPIMSRQSTMRKELTLHDVAKKGKLKDVQMFVAKKVDLNELDRHGVTPIFYAVAQGHLEVVRYLADNGAGEHVMCLYWLLFPFY